MEEAAEAAAAAAAAFGSDLNLKATELRLGLPGREDDESGQQQYSSCPKRSSSEMDHCPRKEAPKAQVVGWPPVRCYRKNALKKPESGGSGLFVKVSMDGAPYLRKIDLKFYKSYFDLLQTLESMFKCIIGVHSEREGYESYDDGCECVPTYEDKDGDWMLVGDIPWDMFITSCKRLRIMKGSEAKGLGLP